MDFRPYDMIITSKGYLIELKVENPHDNIPTPFGEIPVKIVDPMLFPEGVNGVFLGTNGSVVKF